MLEELLKHNNLGSKNELGFILFQAIYPGAKQRVVDVIQFGISNIFSINKSIYGIIELLEYIELITIEGDYLTIQESRFSPKKYNSPNNYFLKPHFFSCLFEKLEVEPVGRNLFNRENIKFNHETKQYYINSNLISFDLFPLRNLLIALGFLSQDHKTPNHFNVAKIFTKFFEKSIVLKLSTEQGTNRVSLKRLKENLEAREMLGKQAELFVVEYERLRLEGHSYIEEVKRISEEYTNAGYDVQSYDSLESVFLDRYIEVKSYQKEISFYWSRNEVETAKEFRSRYYLYLVDRSKINVKGYKPKIIQDPYKRIIENEYWCKEVENWKIKLD